VVTSVNRYRARPRRVADRVFVSCGVYEPLIIRNRSMVPTFESAGMEVRYVEPRDGHSWENWRDRLRDALSWTYPGPQKLVYEWARCSGARASMNVMIGSFLPPGVQKDWQPMPSPSASSR
jgi:hypothetical protein